MFISKELENDYNAFADKVYEAGAIDRKTKELIALACSVMADCSPCIDYHYKKAISYGATKEEISEAAAVTMTICAGSKKAKYSQQFQDLDDKKR